MTAPVSQVLSEAAVRNSRDSLRYLLNWSGTGKRLSTILKTFHMEGDQRVTTGESLERLWSHLGQTADRYLVWSNEHQAWWGPERRGYTRHIERAGRYDRAEAMSIAGTRDGGWHVRKDNPDEIAIPERDAVEQYAAITAALANEQGR